MRCGGIQAETDVDRVRVAQNLIWVLLRIVRIGPTYNPNVAIRGPDPIRADRRHRLRYPPS